jgi:DNA-binding MurR/RpiR family transcriptional regulator
MTAKEQILKRFPALSPTLQDAARFVVDHPNEVVISSMRTLAKRAHAQPATLVRLAQQLGYSGWPELKSVFAEDLGLNTARYGQRAKSLVARGRHADLTGEMFAAQRQNLASTEPLCTASLGLAAKMLKRAKAVHVAGFRASFPIAYSFVYGYRLFRNAVHLIDGQGGGLQMQMRPIERRDAVVAISFAPYSREAIVVVEEAKAAGALVIALTDSNASPLALSADLPVLFSVASPSFFPSVAAAVAVTEALLELLVADAGPAAVEQIDRAEQNLFESGAYLQPRAKRQTSRS